MESVTHFVKIALGQARISVLMVAYQDLLKKAHVVKNAQKLLTSRLHLRAVNLVVLCAKVVVQGATKAALLAKKEMYSYLMLANKFMVNVL